MARPSGKEISSTRPLVRSPGGGPRNGVCVQKYNRFVRAVGSAMTDPCVVVRESPGLRPRRRRPDPKNLRSAPGVRLRVCAPSRLLPLTPGKLGRGEEVEYRRLNFSSRQLTRRCLSNTLSFSRPPQLSRRTTRSQRTCACRSFTKRYPILSLPLSLDYSSVRSGTDKTPFSRPPPPRDAKHAQMRPRCRKASGEEESHSFSPLRSGRSRCLLIYEICVATTGSYSAP